MSAPRHLGIGAALVVLCGAPLAAQVAVRGELVHTMAGPALRDAVVLVRDGKIVAVGPAAEVRIPEGYEVLTAKVVTPGLIDARATAGLAGWLNQDHDKDEVDPAEALQPELRAIDAYNPREPLVAWLREHGVTTLHTGHAPLALVSGQTFVVKTSEDALAGAVLKPAAMVACTLAGSARGEGGKSPGTRAKMIAMLRAALLDAREHMAKQAKATADKPVERSLRKETLGAVLKGDVPLLIHAQRQEDILAALRLQEEFGFRLVLDGAAEGYLVADRLLAAKVPVVVHPTMLRHTGDARNASFETAAKLRDRGIPVHFQSGYEGYVPRTRVVLFEAALAAAHGFGREQALRALTLDAATLLGVQDRIGSLAPGKDADLALYDGDPFEYTSHCTGVLIDGKVVSRTVR